ncbi:MAG: ThuA domain-containing protein, partial [Anaerolineae bacterium]|nr:ThuA domain-containing protein [Anaerolineae bacterium]
VWTKHYGQGRVFYCSLGHTIDIIENPTVLELVTRGMLWAAERETEMIPVL